MSYSSSTVGQFTLGRACSLVFTHPLAPNGRIDMTNVTDFDANAEMTEVKGGPLLMSGKMLTQYIPTRWTYTFTIDRGSPQFDILQAGIDQGWFVGGTLSSGQLYQYVAEVDGSTSTFVFADAVIKLSQSGKWSADQIVKQTINGAASARTKI